MYSEGQWVGHFPLLLPYIEQLSLRDQVRVDFSIRSVTPEKWFWSAAAPGPGLPNVGNYSAAMKDLKILRCPSADSYTPEFSNPQPGGGGTILGLHVFNSAKLGAFTAGWKDEYGAAAQYRPLGRTNYMGVAGCGSGTHPPFSKYEGIYTNRVEHTLGQISIQDGTSHTLLYGENCGSFWQSKPFTMDICWMAGGGLGTYLGLHRGRDAPLIAFSSYHSAGVQFCFADGSVRTVRYGNTRWDGNLSTPFPSDWHLLQQLAGWRDGGAADVTALVD
jgi:prepilin-type processing-associated H-X9-DG protein